MILKLLIKSEFALMTNAVFRIGQAENYIFAKYLKDLQNQRTPQYKTLF
jgi:hypothetical protein